MRPNAAFLMLCILVVCACSAFAQDDPFYSRTKPLETAVMAGTATHDQQIELARLYIDAGRFHEASKLAGRLLAVDPNDAAATAVRVDADKGMHAFTDKKVREAEALANKSGATDQDRLALADAYFDAGSYAMAADTYGRLPDALMTREVRLRQARALA